MISFSAKIALFVMKMSMKNADTEGYINSFAKISKSFGKYKIPAAFIKSTEKCKNGTMIEFIKKVNTSPKKVVYLLHGGAYLLPQQDIYKKYAVNLIKTCGDVEVALLDYKIYPNVYPAAIDDVIAGYDYLLNKGYSEKDIIVHGDSAGGNLALALVQLLKSKKRALPKALFLVSPWTDMTLSTESYKIHYNDDPILGGKGKFNEKIREKMMNSDMYAYFKGADLQDPLVSPIFADFTDFPDTYITVGANEMLLCDSTVVAEKMKANGCKVGISIVDEMFHVFPLFSSIKEGKAAQNVIFYKMKKHL